MKNISIRLKTTILFSVIIIITAVGIFLLVRQVSATVLRNTVRNYLINTVDARAEEFAWREYTSMDWHSEIALYDSDGKMLYGRDSLAEVLSDRTFRSPEVFVVNANGADHYVYERKITADGMEGLWLRGSETLKQEKQQLQDIMRMMLVILPVAVVITIAISWLALGKMLKPISEIERTASEISQGKDLGRRINLGEGKDELHKMAATFDTMFDRLEYSFEAEQRFTSDVSHELRTPMAVIVNQTELTLEKDRTPEEYREALTVIERQSNRMSRLINDMLYYTRLEKGADMYPMEEIDMSALTESICRDMAVIRTKDIVLASDIRKDIMVQGNAMLLTRMLQNLIDNAYKYGVEDGRTIVSLNTNDDGEAVLTVSDNGLGIAPEEQGKIFDRFYRTDSSRSGRTAGNGLGLSMVKKICDMHDATIRVESDTGKGSRFEIVFKKGKR